MSNLKLNYGADLDIHDNIAAFAHNSLTAKMAHVALHTCISAAASALSCRVFDSNLRDFLSIGSSSAELTESLASESELSSLPLPDDASDASDASSSLTSSSSASSSDEIKAVFFTGKSSSRLESSLDDIQG
jgi:hypothetical protein